VTVTGPLEQVQSIDAVRGLETEEIAIADARDDVLSAVQLALPDGVTVQGPTTVNVSIDIAPARGVYTFRIVPLIRNAGNGLSVTPAGAITLTLSGDVPVLEDITAESISASADAQGLGVGLYTLPVAITAPPGTTIVGDPPEIGVAITLAQ
jgi:YbbR domain-containing protein